MDTVSFSEFSRLDLRVGEVKEASNLENSEKLIRFTVDFGEQGTRNILTGLRQYISPEQLEGGYFVFVLNLEPKKMAGEESQGMILCVDSQDGPKPIVAPKGSSPGDKVR